MSKSEDVTVYARNEGGTTVTPPEIAVYSGPECQQEIARWSWCASGRPGRGQRIIMLNGEPCVAIWMEKTNGR